MFQELSVDLKSQEIIDRALGSSDPIELDNLFREAVSQNLLPTIPTIEGILDSKEEEGLLIDITKEFIEAGLPSVAIVLVYHGIWALFQLNYLYKF